MNVQPIAVTESVAAFSTSLRIDRIPVPVVTVAKACLEDLIGVTLVGVPQEASRISRQWVENEACLPVCTVLGTQMRTSASNAAFANGVAGHALDMDDVSLAMRGHPSIVAGSAVLALAEQMNASGAQLLTAFIAGVETIIALGFGVGRSHYAKGWHSTATLGTIGAAVSCANLMGLSSPNTKLAIGIAASMSAGTRCNFGSMTKPLHAGLAAKNGLIAAQLASRGFTASTEALASPIGLFRLMSDDSKPEKTVERLGKIWSLVEPGINFKRYACCYGLHHAIDAADWIRKNHITGDLNAEHIQSIHVIVAPGGMAALIHDRPVNGLQAKFSLPYAVSASLLYGAPTLSSFDDMAVHDPVVQALMQKVSYEEAAGEPVTGDDPRFANVCVRFSNGTCISKQVNHPSGSPQQPLTQDQLDEKFLDVGRSVLAPEQLQASLGVLHLLEQHSTIDQLFIHLQSLEKETSIGL